MSIPLFSRKTRHLCLLYWQKQGLQGIAKTQVN
jgi:hypothetical protein